MGGRSDQGSTSNGSSEHACEVAAAAQFDVLELQPGCHPPELVALVGQPVKRSRGIGAEP